MNLVEPKYAPADIERLKVSTSDVLRDRRRRGLLDGWGEQAGNRWLYSGHEVVALAVADLVSRTGVDLAYALWIGWETASRAVGRLIDDKELYSKRFGIFWTTNAGKPWVRTDGFELQWWWTNDLAELTKSKATAATVIDVEHIARHLPAELVAEIRSGASK